VTINERKSHYVLIKRLTSKQAPVIRKVIVTKLIPFTRLAHTLTTDNGKEFAHTSGSPPRSS
jgi:IS30 family transposase